MVNEIMSMALGNGIWAALFCFLFLYMLKDSRQRESKYSSMIETLNDKLGKTISALKICEDIKKNGEAGLEESYEIKSDTQQIREDVEALRTSLTSL